MEKEFSYILKVIDYDWKGDICFKMAHPRGSRLYVSARNKETALDKAKEKAEMRISSKDRFVADNHNVPAYKITFTK